MPESLNNKTFLYWEKLHVHKIIYGMKLKSPASLLMENSFSSIPNGQNFNSYINISTKKFITLSWHLLSLNSYKCYMITHQTQLNLIQFHKSFVDGYCVKPLMPQNNFVQ